MKRVFVVIFTIMAFAGLMQGVIEPFDYLGEVRFAGKPAVYARPDSLILVYQDDFDRLCFRIQTDDSANPSISYPLLNINNCKAPTLLYSPGDCYITSNRGIGKSSDGGISWQGNVFRYISTMENSPILESYNNQLHLFENRVPYPDELQSQFTIPGTDEFPIPQLIVDRPYWQGPTGSYTSLICGGTDYYAGPVFINGDLWIKHSVGLVNPDAPGWPRFDGPVFCSGQVRVQHGGGYPINSIFNGGLYQNQTSAYLPSCEAVFQHGQVVGPISYSPDHIVYIEVNGDTYTAMLGRVLRPRREHREVWPSYPMGSDLPPDAINHYTVSDTVWTQISSGPCANRGNFVNSKLWIKGHFSNKQVWAASDTICIIGDVTLDGVTPGLPPTNANDAVTLISDKSILLKYGYKSPIDNTRIHPLCRADSDPIYIYANLVALGDGRGIEEKDGVFSFEYQHPHPSIPDLRVSISSEVDSLFTDFDLHRNYYPQTTQHMWPGWLDYPWYNPLWPEAHPYLGRGTVKHYGGVYQRRWGKLWGRRAPDPNHNPDNLWDIGFGKYGGPSNEQSQEITLWQDPPQSINLHSMNYPGASQLTVGYSYEGYYPANMSLSSMSAFMQEGIWNLGLSSGYWYSDGIDGSSYYHVLMKPQLKMTKVKRYANRGQSAAYSVNDLLIYRENQEITDLSSLTEGDGLIKGLAFGAGNTIWLSQQVLANFLHIKQIDTITEHLIQEFNIPVNSGIHDLYATPSGSVFLVKQLQGTQFGVYFLNQGTPPVQVDTWNLVYNQGYPALTFNDNSNLYVFPAGEQKIRVLLWNKRTDNTGRGHLYETTAELNVDNCDDILPQPVPASFSCYPNPMRGNLQIKLSLPTQTKAELAVYNLKGQKIRSYDGLNADNAVLTWDGLDQQGKSTASGIYFLRLTSDGKIRQSKRICKL